MTKEKISSYLNFSEPVKISKRTVVVKVSNARSKDRLGEIRWYGPWRQYCFYPVHATIFNRGCLREIADRCEFMTKNHWARRPIT